MFSPTVREIAAVTLVCLAGCGSHNRGASVRGTGAGHLRPINQAAKGLPPEGHRGEPTSGDADEEPHAASSQVPAARSVARTFFRSYIAFLYGRLPPSRVAEVDPGLRSQLEQGRGTTTPAERATRPRIAHLTLSSSGPPISVLAVATVTARCCRSSTLAATLEPQHGAWLVVAVTG